MLVIIKLLCLVATSHDVSQQHSVPYGTYFNQTHPVLCKKINSFLISTLSSDPEKCQTIPAFSTLFFLEVPQDILHILSLISCQAKKSLFSLFFCPWILDASFIWSCQIIFCEVNTMWVMQRGAFASLSRVLDSK